MYHYIIKKRNGQYYYESDTAHGWSEDIFKAQIFGSNSHWEPRCKILEPISKYYITINEGIEINELLPNELSELLKIGIQSCQSVVKRTDKKYKLSMDTRYRDIKDRTGEIVCYVGMNGAVMVECLGITDDLYNDLDEDIENKLMAINLMSENNFEGAASYIDLEVSRDLFVKIEEMIYADWNENKQRASFNTYKKAVKMLQELGL